MPRAVTNDVTLLTDFDPADVERVSHRRRLAIHIADPDPTWPAQFSVLAGRIRAALAPDRMVSVEHVGSTSVPGLPAKPVIDVDLVVPDAADEDSYVQALEGQGFQFLFRERPWHEHRFFGFDSEGIYANLHVFGPGCPETVRHILFRDWLKEHDDDRAAYVKVKREAAELSEKGLETVDEYNKRKEWVIREILGKIFRAQGLLAAAEVDAAEKAED